MFFDKYRKGWGKYTNGKPYAKSFVCLGLPCIKNLSKIVSLFLGDKKCL